jgi:hypothetical protein
MAFLSIRFDHLAKYMRIPVADERESNLFDKLSETTKFISKFIHLYLFCIRYLCNIFYHVP